MFYLFANHITYKFNVLMESKMFLDKYKILKE